MTLSLQQTRRRFRQTLKLVRARGLGGLNQVARAGLAGILAPASTMLPVRPADVLAADLRRPRPRVAPAWKTGEPMTINWVMTPPAPGSGGHTTVFRMINHLAAQGHVNRVYFYDVHVTDHAYYTGVVRDYYGFAGEISDVDDGLRDAHILMATGWPTAYAVFNAPCKGIGCYFVQDFEPSFHPTSSSSVMAENTYRMGLHGITAGAWLAAKLDSGYGMDCTHFDFGCDVGDYARDPSALRDGIAFYVRFSAARRASELGLMAIELFARRRPDVGIHLYGEKIGPRPFAFNDHGKVSTSQLNAIYNRCYAGLTLSLTNVSLVPHEMLACGCIPLVNDADHNRIVLNNAFVRYAPLSPHALAAELEAIVDSANFESVSEQAAQSVRSASWSDAGHSIEAAMQRLLRP
jgi:hypothetical protein